METRARHNGANIAGLHMLQQQLRVYEEMFKDLANTVRDSINTQQKDTNREFIPVITAAMVEAYNACVEERGPYFPLPPGRQRSSVSSMNTDTDTHTNAASNPQAPAASCA